MSAQVVAPRGNTKTNIRQTEGATRELAHAVMVSPDTIERRAFAWRQWQRFQQDTLVDENGEELDYTHKQIRDRLYYSHFATLGRMVESGEITSDSATTMLIIAVRDRQSVSQMLNALNVLLEVVENFEATIWEPFTKRSLSLLSYPEVNGRRKKLLQELLGTDWTKK